MSDIEKIQLFEDQKVRTIWLESDEKWYFSIKDVILILAEAKDPKDYLSKMRRREPELAKGWGQIVHPLVVRTPGGPQKENFAKVAKEAFEKQTGKKVVSSMSMKRYIASQQPKLELGTGEAVEIDGQEE